MWLSLLELLGLLLSPFSLACHETSVPFLRNIRFLTVLSNVFREFFHISEHSKLLFSTFPWVHVVCKMGWLVLWASSQGTGLFFNCIIDAEGLHLIFLVLLFCTIQQSQIQNKLHSLSQKFWITIHVWLICPNPLTPCLFSCNCVQSSVGKNSSDVCLDQSVAIKVVCFTLLSCANMKNKQGSLVSERRVGRGHLYFPTVIVGRAAGWS